MKQHIHYKNDFEFLLKIMDKGGFVREVPQYRWSVVFSVDGVRYECSLRDGNAVVKGDMIVCRLQDHGFGCGELKAEFREWIPNKEWLDGVVDVSTPIDTDIELWEGKSDDSEETVSGSVVSAYFVYDAYLTAKANGYEGTAEEYYNAITGVVDIAEAEAGRVKNEEQREANEQQRVREFDAMKAKVDNVYTKAESDARYLRGEVIYEDYYYPNMGETTDKENYSDSTEILQPTNFIESYTDADGTTWDNVFECEKFPDWFNFAEKSCYSYSNGNSTGYLFFHNFTVENNELIYDFYTLQNNNIGQKLPYYADRNGLGLKKIDATHFKVYTTKEGTIKFTAMNKTNIDCSLFGFSSLVYCSIYDIDDCNIVRITLTGNIQSPSRYSSLLSGSSDIGLFGYSNRQVLYGDEYVEIEIDKKNARWRQIKSGYSMFYRSNYSQNWTANKPESYESECHCLWSKIPSSQQEKICMINNKVCYAFSNKYNPRTILQMGCKIKIEKLG